MSNYRKVRAETAEKMGAELAQQLPPCRYCSTPTPYETLSRLGARCQACYEAYCRDASSHTELPRGQLSTLGTTDPHAWAHRLQSRRADGERLSPAQRHCLEVFERRHSVRIEANDDVPDAVRMAELKQRARDLTDRFNEAGGAA